MVLNNINWVYFGGFVVYLLVVLGIGLWGWRQVTTQSDFATADRSLGLLMGVGSLFASFMSALTVIGGFGYASNYGWSFIVYYLPGAIAGMAFLSVTAKIWHQTGVNSISELVEIRYGSKSLRALMSCIIVLAYAVTLVAQLYGIGFIVEGIIGIPMWIGVLTIGLFFVAYTVLGGMVSIARTDLIQASVMGIGVLIIFSALIIRVFNDPTTSFTDAENLMTIYSGESSNNIDLAALFLIYGFGISIHPYYVQRVMSAKDVRTARLIPAVNSILLLIFYFLVTVGGIIGFLYLPNQVGDTMAPAIITELVGGVLGTVAMMAILAGVQSTTDSLLHISGTYISQDIYKPYFADGNMSDKETVKWSRIFTGIFGILTVGIATLQLLVGEIALIVVIGEYAWSILGGSLFIPIAFGIFWKNATREGAIAATVSGFVGVFIGNIFVQFGFVSFNPIFLAVGLSFAAMIIGSTMSESTSEENLESIFQYEETE
jgi:SSS family transporter